MMLSLWTVIALFYRLANAQLPDQGNAVEFPPSFGMAGGLLSGMLGFVDMFDPSLQPPPPSPGFASTDPPSPPQGSTSAGQVTISSTGVVDPITHLNPQNISTNDAEGNVVTLPTDAATTLPPSRRSPPPFDISTPVGVTEKPKPRDPFFIDMSSLRRTQSTGPTGADSSQSVHMNATGKDVKSAGQSSGTDAKTGSSFSGSGDPLIDLFGGLPALRSGSLVNALVNATTTKATTTTTTTKRPVLPAAPVSNQQIFQMLNTFSNQRVVLGKSQGKHEGQQKSNTPPGQAKGLNKDHGPAQIGDKNSGNTGHGQSHRRGAGLSGWLL